MSGNLHLTIRCKTWSTLKYILMMQNNAIYIIKRSNCTHTMPLCIKRIFKRSKLMKNKMKKTDANKTLGPM